MQAAVKTKLKMMVTLSSLLVLVVAMCFAPQFAKSIAYAVTNGQYQADKERLAEMSKNDTLSPLFAQVAKTLKPSVVEVRVTKRVDAANAPDMDDFFRRFFGEEPNGTPRQKAPLRREMQGLGSGVIVSVDGNKGEGYVVTNNHVVVGADQVQVVTSDNRTLEAEWVRTDRRTDIAVVKVKGDGLIAASLGDSDAMEVGFQVLAIGSPEGLPQTVTSGIISAKGRSQPGLGGSTNLYQNFLQTDAAINHGNSGGPLVNMKGEVIGINTAIVSRTGVNEGIGLAIPSNMVGEIMKQLIDKGKVTRGYVGVSLQPIDEKLAKSFKLPGTEGALVAKAAPGGPADKAGLKPGDFIVAVSGKPVRDINSLRNLVAGIAPGTSVPVEFYRDGKKQSLPVKIEEQPKELAAAFTGQPSEQGGGEEAVTKLGIKVETLTPELAQQYGYKKGATGVVVASVEESSDTADKGIAKGSLITSVNGHPVATAEQFAKLVSAKDAADGVRLQVSDPQGNTMFVFVAPTRAHTLNVPKGGDDSGGQGD